MSDRRTKAQLLENIQDLKDRIDNPPMAQMKPAPLAAEGVAVSECISALDALNRRGQSTNLVGISYGEGQYTPLSTPVSRVLRHLAEYYDVRLVEIRQEPCSRPHVDEIDSYAVENAIKSAVRR